MRTTKQENGKESIPTDKRTKAYKQYQKNLKEAPEGLGDKIEKVTKATGIKKAVDTVFDALGADCGCDQRKQKLNELFPSTKPECFTEEEFELMRMAVETNKQTFTGEETKQYTAIYNRVFKQNVACIPCSFRKTVWQSLVQVYNQYK